VSEKIGQVRRDGNAPGFVQDYFYTIFQFFWLPFAWLSVRAFYLVPKTLSNLWEQNAIGHENAPDALTLNILIERYITEINQKMSKIWPWNVGILVGLVAMVYQVLVIQMGRIQDNDMMYMMYWWDWRISKDIYIARLLMVGLDFALLTMIVIKGGQSIKCIRTFSTKFKLIPQVLHPDKAGGLASVGRLCFSFAFPLLLGAILLLSSFLFHKETEYLFINLLVLLVHVFVAILTFFYPLNTIHSNMKNFKESTLNRISLKINKIISELDETVESRSDTSSHHDNLENLNRYYQTVEKTPVWPFDIKTFSQFIGTVLPITLAILGKMIEFVITKAWSAGG